MNLTKTVRYTAAAVALGALGLGLVPTAQAVAMYRADALIQVTLTRISSGTLGSNVFVTYENQVTGQDTISSGPTSFAIADPYIFPDHSTQNMRVFDTLEQDHIALGEAGSPFGTAYSLLQSTGYIYLENHSGAPVDFEFEYSIVASVDTRVTGSPAFADAFAAAIVEIFDDTSTSVDIYETLSANLATSVTGQELDLSGTFTITVEDGNFSNVSVFVDTYGNATYVPEPGSVWLIGSGLALLAFRRRAAA